MSTSGQRFTNNRHTMKKHFNNNNKPTGQNPRMMNGIKTNREAVIRRNLEHMKQVAEKKRIAQERYYKRQNNRTTGRSPMIKTTSGPFVKQENNNRGSVRQRLGPRGKQINNANTNKTVFINTKPTHFVGMRSDKIIRVQNIQQRKGRYRNPNNTVKTINSSGKVVYLQPLNSRRPTNYTVKVENDRKHHVQNGLNPVLQQEIKMIQNKAARQIVNPIAPNQAVLNTFENLPIVSTGKTLHERFSSI